MRLAGLARAVRSSRVALHLVNFVGSPTCGSLVRDIELRLSGAVNVSGSLSWTKIHEKVERSWPWLLGSIMLTVAGSLIGLVLGDVLGLVVGLVIGLLSFPVGLRAATRIREIEHGGER
jgi:ABC-type amino acid transport system permease subunit